MKRDFTGQFLSLVVVLALSSGAGGCWLSGGTWGGGSGADGDAECDEEGEEDCDEEGDTGEEESPRPPETWVMRITDPLTHSYFNFIVETGGGDLVLMGVIHSGGDEQDIWTVRLGSREWAKIIGAVEGREWIGGFIQTSDGSFAAAGWLSESFMGETRALLMKIGDGGDILWQKSIPGCDRLDGVVESPDGNLLVSGSAGGSLYIAEIDPSGAMIRQHVFAQEVSSVNFYDILQSSEGDILAAGHGSEEADLARVSLDGSVSWYRHFASLPDNGSNELSLVELPDGRIVASMGSFIVMLDRAGNPQWQKEFPNGYGAGTDVVESDDGGLLFLTATESAGGDPDMWLFKTDEAGRVLWQKTLVLDGLEAGNDVLPSSGGGLFALSGGAYWSNLALLDMNGELHEGCDVVEDTTIALGEASILRTDVDVEVQDPGFVPVDAVLPAVDAEKTITYPCPPVGP